MAVITIYGGARRPQAVDSCDLPWNEIADELEKLANEPPGAPETADVEDQKKAMLAWAPHALKPGAARGAAGVDHVSLLVVDVDHGATPEAVVQRMHDAGFACLVYESAKSTPEAPRFRVVAPVTTPIAPDDSRETRCRFAEALGLNPDCGVLGAQEAAKLFFSGRAHGTPPRRVWRTEGESLDPMALPPNSPAWVARIATVAHDVQSPHLAQLPPADAGVVAALGDWRMHAGRKWSLCGAVGGLLKKLGYSSYQCESTIRAWLPVGDPTVDVDAGVSWALGAFSKDAGDVSGYQELARHVGEKHADVIEAAAWAASWGGRAAARVRPLEWLRPAIAPSTDPLGRRVFCAIDDGPIPYECAGLGLAPSLGKISLIGGLPGAGKGPIADYLAACWALGVPVFQRWQVVRQQTLLLDVEGARLTKHRSRRMARALGYDPATLDEYLDIRDVSRVSMLDDRFMYALEAHPAKIVILDSYTSAMLASELDQFKAEYARFAQALAALDRLVLVVAHARKPSAGTRGERPLLEDIAGSGALGAMAQTALSVWRPDDDVWSRVRVSCARAPEHAFETFDVEFADLENGGLAVNMISGDQVAHEVATTETAEVTRMMNAVLAWLVAHPQPWPRKVIREAVVVHGVSKSGLIPEGDIAGLLARLTTSGLVTSHPGVGAKQATYEITSVQRTPAAIMLQPDGAITAMPAAGGVAGFRRG